MELVKEVYKQTKGFPKYEIYGMTSQIQRAAVSIPTNISEGSGRLRSKEFHYLLRVASGSLSELETLLLIAMDLDYIKEEQNLILLEKIKTITFQLSRLIIAIEKKIVNSPLL